MQVATKVCTKGEEMWNGDGPRGFMDNKNVDQGDSWRQKHGSGGFRGDDMVEQGIPATMLWTRRIRSKQARTGWQRSALARTWRSRIHASTDLKSKGRASADLKARGPHKGGPGGSRSGQGRARVQESFQGYRGEQQG